MDVPFAIMCGTFVLKGGTNLGRITVNFVVTFSFMKLISLYMRNLWEARINFSSSNVD